MRVVTADAEAALSFYNNALCRPGLSYSQTKRRQLIEFGVPDRLIAGWDALDRGEWLGPQLEHLLATRAPAMDRMHPDGCTRLGLYAKGIGDALAANRQPGRGTVLDFGCGPWVDASLYFAARLCGDVLLADIHPLTLAFARWQLQQAKVPCADHLVQVGEDEALLVGSETALIIESSAFEHVPDLRHLFPKMMERLSPGALFLTNYTRLDWTDPQFDGYQDNKDFAAEAMAVAQDLAYRHEWEPVQGLWDLWCRK